MADNQKSLTRYAFGNKEGMRQAGKIVALLGLCSLTLFGQDGYTNYSEKVTRYSLGPCMGVGSSFTAAHHELPVWNAGLSAVFSPMEHWGIGMDLRYSIEGSTEMNELGLTERELEYIRVPAKVICFFGKRGDALRPKVSLGPSLGFLVKQEERGRAQGFDAGILGSAGFNFRLIEQVWLGLDVNYYQGLTDIYPYTSQKEMNNTVYLNFGMNFAF